MTRYVPLIVFIPVLAACLPDLAIDETLVDGRRLLAVRAVPAESAPGRKVTFSALVVDEHGQVAASALDWSFCTTRLPLTEQGSVAEACIQQVQTSSGADASTGTSTTAVMGRGPEIAAALPRDGCRLFGPTPPAAALGEEPGRSVDPDPTGGYYQPVLVRDGAASVTVGGVRLTCGLAGATREVALDYARRYRANSNPALESLTTITGTTIPGPDGVPLEVKVNTALELRATWPACAPEATCTGREPYVILDSSSSSLLDRRETLRLSWYATGGHFRTAANGIAGDASERALHNTWTAPASPGDVTLWVVVRDDRGGTGWSAHQLRVIP
jgi:hypothetical protein